MTDAAASPRTEYEARLEARRAAFDRAERMHGRIATARLLIVLAGIGAGWLAIVRQSVPPWSLAIPAVAFFVLVAMHARVARKRSLAQRAIDFYTRAMDRISGKWAGAGETGERFRNGRHPYADDLDLFGQASLFELLSSARTRAGENTLARWLQTGAAHEEVIARQRAVAELRARLDLREDMAVLGEDFRTGVHPEALAEWGAAPPVVFPEMLRWIAAGLAVLASALLAALFATAFEDPAIRVGLLVVAGCEGLLALAVRERVLRVVAAAGQPGHDLELLAQVLERFEKERFESEKLKALRKALDVAGKPASARIARLRRLIELLDSRDNVAVRAFGPLVLWTTQVAFAIERWRAVSGPSVGQWLDAVGELEALCSLAGYAYEHPDDPFPEFTDGPPCFRGEALGHPLLSEAACVRNDLRLCPEPRLIIVSGSNMSGKSTLLRTVGANAVLAMAGAPVRARRLVLSDLRIGASIRVTDSLQGGTSRFYAEITRIREIVRLCERGPTLFLLDELLNGTNSRDREIGAGGVVRGLLDRGAIGLITTHDLALTAIAEGLKPVAVNMHFEDHLENGVITFDYKIRPGVVQKSNALELMRAVGLEV